VSARVYEVDDFPFLLCGSGFGTTFTILDYDTGMTDVGPYGTDYILLTDVPKWRSKLFFFSGDSFEEDEQYRWRMTDDGWDSGAEHLVDYLLYGEAYVDPGNPTLEMFTYWDIEDYWDFGFVQVSTDGGATWASLENEYTTYDYDPSAKSDIVANLPGLTGWSGDFMAITFDLTAYAGQTVMIGFRYMTDWATVYEGWYIDGVWVSGNAMELTPVFPEWNWQVTLIGVKYKRHYYWERHRWGWRCRWRMSIDYKVQDFGIDDLTDVGFSWLTWSCYDKIYLVVSPTGTVGSADYCLKGAMFHWCWCR